MIKSWFSADGSSLIETVLVMHSLFILILSIFSFSFYFYTKVTLQVALHEALVCTIREKNAWQCKSWTKEKLNKVLFWGQLNHFTVNQNYQYTSGKIIWAFTNSLDKLKVQHTYQLKTKLIKPTKRAFF